MVSDKCANHHCLNHRGAPMGSGRRCSFVFDHQSFDSESPTLLVCWTLRPSQNHGLLSTPGAFYSSFSLRARCVPTISEVYRRRKSDCRISDVRNNRRDYDSISSGSTASRQKSTRGYQALINALAPWKAWRDCSRFKVGRLIVANAGR